MRSARAPHSNPPDLRNRAVRLVEKFFLKMGERGRETFFLSALGDVSHDPCKQIEFSGSVAEFSAEAVDKLLAFGGAGRGRHCLSLLLAAMQETLGRQSDPDYCELQRELDAACALPTREEEQCYLARLIEETANKARLYSPLHGVARTRPAQKKDRALNSLWEDEQDLALLRHRFHRRDMAVEGPELQRDYGDILAAFPDVPRAALLGAPGSGKSTTLRKLALELAKRAQADPDAPLPVLAALGDWRGDEPLLDFLSKAAPEIGWAARALSHAKRLTLLLDGINEVPTAKRAAKAAEVRSIQSGLHPETAIIVSCRQEDYTRELDLELDTLTLEPLSPQRIRAAVRQWVSQIGEPLEKADRFVWQLAGDEELAGVMAKWEAAGAGEDAFWILSDPREHEQVYRTTTGRDDELWRRHVPNPRNLVRLAANPFMLTMLFHVWWEAEHFPENRGDLFGEFINHLLRRENLAAFDAATKTWHLEAEGTSLLGGLAGLAWGMQRERAGAGEESFEVLTVTPRADAVEALGGETLLKKAVDATLLEGGDQLRFRHQLLQEYFTAQALEKRLGETDPREFWPAERWWERSGWEEALVLLAGFHSNDCTPVIRWLAGAQPEAAARCILESGAGIADRPRLLCELKAAWLPRLAGPKCEPQPEGRAAVGRALGRLGLDTRKGVGLTAHGLPDIDWVEIPAGEFIYQEGEQRKLGCFFVARYPVTNAQYQAFLDALDGYRQDRWWKGMDRPDRQPAAPKWTEPNHPRETVSWHEAMAFCGWLGYKRGFEVRLPTEWEWERAARGTDGRPFPWVGEYQPGYANIDETWGGAGSHSLGRTSPVGIYPAGASPEGVMDLSGNVWEWCLNDYEKPDHIQRGGRESRVLRGGAWNGSQGYARAVFRSRGPPGCRGGHLGFRVVCSSPIAEH
ncbi:MAG: SUMF1/EgtB/PvdO family nonheme iron enzyme [Bryobacterales bacterium]|nr:SUMF1/EgtB/PvdO family nonheme iron enzyme [Bryobacterales bacterium]